MVSRVLRFADGSKSRVAVWDIPHGATHRLRTSIGMRFGMKLDLEPDLVCRYRVWNARRKCWQKRARRFHLDRVEIIMVERELGRICADGRR